MIASERNLRTLILLVYSMALSHMLWTGEIFRFVGGWVVPWLWASCALLWLLTVAGLWGRATSSHAAEAPEGLWAQGILYAIFSLPPVLYLLSGMTGDLHWF